MTMQSGMKEQINKRKSRKQQEKSQLFLEAYDKLDLVQTMELGKIEWGQYIAIMREE